MVGRLMRHHRALRTRTSYKRAPVRSTVIAALPKKAVKPQSRVKTVMQIIGVIAFYVAIGLGIYLLIFTGRSSLSPTATCRDGTVSSSQHHQGTCSWHGGVA